MPRNCRPARVALQLLLILHKVTCMVFYMHLGTRINRNVSTGYSIANFSLAPGTCIVKDLLYWSQVTPNHIVI